MVIMRFNELIFVQHMGHTCHGSNVDQVLQHTYYQGHTVMPIINNFYRRV